MPEKITSVSTNYPVNKALHTNLVYSSCENRWYPDTPSTLFRRNLDYRIQGRIESVASQ
ncbi:MAG: hypothetical protein JW801_15270 [Bacteroidales bacterium]|nr:hypothetical protein [Bacteroidales bacterium]